MGFVGSTFGLFMRSLPWIRLVQMLVAIGMSVSTAKKYATLVTPPRYAKDGTMVPPRRGEFPFPYGLYMALMQKGPVDSDRTKQYFAVMDPQSISVFRSMYIPIASRQDLPAEDRKRIMAHVALHHKDSVDAIMQRVSEWDVMVQYEPPDLARLAADAPGLYRSTRWVREYAIAKGFHSSVLKKRPRRHRHQR